MFGRCKSRSLPLFDHGISDSFCIWSRLGREQGTETEIPLNMKFVELGLNFEGGTTGTLTARTDAKLSDPPTASRHGLFCVLVRVVLLVRTSRMMTGAGLWVTQHDGWRQTAGNQFCTQPNGGCSVLAQLLGEENPMKANADLKVQT